FVLHTLNFRLSAQDLTYIINHAEDSVIFVDANVWPVLEAIRDKLPSVRRVVIMRDTPDAEVPPGLDEYEALLATATPVTGWPRLAETDAADICELIQNEKVTFTGAVPTVWIAVKELCEAEGWNISSLRTIAIGGSAAPKHLQLAYKNQFGVVMSHAWGMTEMTPLGTIGRLK